MIEQAPYVQDGGHGRVFQPLSELEMCIHFSQGTARGRELVEIFPTRQATVALGDICGNRDGGLSDLSGKAIPLVAWESTGQVIASDSEVYRRLPDAKISVVASALHGHSPRGYREQVHSGRQSPVSNERRVRHFMSDRPNEISDEAQRWVIGSRTVVIDRPFVFGILNVTPDSFSDGGRFDTFDAAIAHAQAMLEQGADAIDIGGESTRPQGAHVVSVDEETRRVIPVVRGLRAKFPAALISVDTTKSEVAAAAMDAGADIINDVSGFRLDPRMGEIVAAGGAGVVLMHSRGSVSEMGTYLHANYQDTVGDVISELEQSLERAAAAGVRRECVVLDPGVGFAKRSEHSLRILNELRRVVTLGLPIMVGVSRKRFVGELARVETTDQRVAGTIGANVAALMNGACLFRVHDVAPNRQALDVAWGVLRAGPGSRFPVPGSRAE